MIRPLTRIDVEQIRSLADEGTAEGFQFVARFVSDLESAEFPLDDRRQFFLGAFDGNRLVAIGGVTPDPHLDDKHIGRIRHVYVARDARRCGVGLRLIDALELRARHEYTTLRLRTDTEAAAAFYEAIGYQRTNEANATHCRALMRDRATPNFASSPPRASHD
jgi:ribosomal protein S18 acetylase RimI-like enzyme